MKSVIGTYGRSAGAALLPCIAFLLSAPAAAANLDAKAARSLISNQTWATRSSAGTMDLYWTWKSDGTVCVRNGERAGSCMDTGTWKLEGERMCYELTWWGAESGFKSACYRITDLGKARYGAVQDNGITIFEFAVAR